MQWHASLFHYSIDICPCLNKFCNHNQVNKPATINLEKHASSTKRRMMVS